MILDGDKEITVQKGAVNREWFQAQYSKLDLKQEVEITNAFRVERKSMTIQEKTSTFTLSLPESTKRERVLDSNNKWIDTKPIRLVLSQSPHSVVSEFLTIQSMLDKLNTPEEGMDESIHSHSESSETG